MSTTTLEPDTREKTALTEQDLEEWLSLMDLEPEPPCQFKHREEFPCSIHVVARGLNCVPSDSLNVCEVARGLILHTIKNNLKICARCLRPVADCWRVVPI